MHAEEDNKKRERMEALNQAESTIYQMEKALEEVGDKATEEEKEAVKTAIEELKAAEADENSTAEELREKMDNLMNKFHPISQKMYEQSQAEQAADPGAGQTASPEDDVVDAEIVE